MLYDEEHDLFVTKKQEPVSITVTMSGTTTFYNKKYGSQLQDKTYELDFSNELAELTPLNSEFSKITSLVYVERSIKYTGEQRTTNRGHVVRDAILKDSTSDMQLTMWNSLCHLKENQWYVFTDVEVKHQFGKLETTRTTGAEEKQHEVTEFTEQELNRYNPQSQDILCCPAIISVDMKTSIVHCETPINATENAKVGKCPDCNRTINLLRRFDTIVYFLQNSSNFSCCGKYCNTSEYTIKSGDHRTIS